jgi:hypothetical protein
MMSHSRVLSTYLIFRELLQVGPSGAARGVLTRARVASCRIRSWRRRSATSSTVSASAAKCSSRRRSPRPRPSPFPRTLAPPSCREVERFAAAVSVAGYPRARRRESAALPHRRRQRPLSRSKPGAQRGALVCAVQRSAGLAKGPCAVRLSPSLRRRSCSRGGRAGASTSGWTRSRNRWRSAASTSCCTRARRRSSGDGPQQHARFGPGCSYRPLRAARRSVFSA